MREINRHHQVLDDIWKTTITTQIQLCTFVGKYIQHPLHQRKHAMTNQIRWGQLLVKVMKFHRQPGVSKRITQDNKTDFLLGSACIDRSLPAQHMLELRYICHRPTIAGFFDLKTPFDSVDRPVLWCYLSLNSVPETLSSLYQSVYGNNQSRVRV